MTKIKIQQKLIISLILGLNLVGCGGVGSENTETKDLPIAVDDTSTVTENSAAIGILVLANDTSGGMLDLTSVEIITVPQNGSATVTNTGEVKYTPTSNYYGTDSFVYTMKDTDGNFSNPATVNITITRLPDITPPVITIIGGDVSIAKPGSYNDAGATAIDDRDGTVDVTTTSTVNVDEIGEYTVTYTAKDSQNNTTQAVRNVAITAQFLTTTKTPYLDGNCIKFVDREGYDDNENNVLDDIEVTALSNDVYDKGDPITRAQLDMMIANDADVTDINTCVIEDLSSLFLNNTTFNQDISQWNVGSVTNMHSTFNSARVFSGDIGDWDVSNVIDMSWMFNEANSFNQNIGSWKVGKVTNMRGMFNVATTFDQDISAWDVSNVTDMYWMFRYASRFNQDINRWDVSEAIDMSLMFAEASAFNQDISSWSVEKVTNMTKMFKNSAFNNSIANWDVRNVSDMTEMFNGVTLSSAVYDAILIGWDNSSEIARDGLTPWIDRVFDGGLSVPTTTGSDSRKNLIGREGWIITDGDSYIL